MQRTDGANATANGQYQDANPGTGQLATSMTANALNALTEELVSLATVNGVPLQPTKFNQALYGVFQMAWPVGSIYLDTVGTQNPQQILGFGTWAEIGKGCVLVGLDTTQVEFNAMGKTGGEKTHMLSVAEMPSHTHAFSVIALNSDSSGSGSITGGAANSANDGEFNGTTGATGGGEAHNNLQPYLVVRMWTRTA